MTEEKESIIDYTSKKIKTNFKWFFNYGQELANDFVSIFTYNPEDPNKKDKKEESK